MSRLIRNSVIITDPITGKEANVEENGGLAVNIQDQSSLALDQYFIQATAAVTTLSVGSSAGDYTITVTTTTGFIDGAVIGISALGAFYFGEQVGAIAGNTVTLDRPLDNDFAAGTNVFPATKEMAIDGSVTPQVFQIGPVGAGSGIYIDVTRVMGWMQDGTAMDDSLFGGLTALTNGILLRRNNYNADYTNYWNAKTNGELALICFDFAYAVKAPAGSFGARFRNTYGGQNKHGVVIRLAPGDTLEMVVQDDLTGLEAFNMMAQGHFVTD